MPYALAAVDDALLVGTADGRILQSGDDGETWKALAEGLGFVVAMSAATPEPSDGHRARGAAEATA